jgi:hypothetical protein
LIKLQDPTPLRASADGSWAKFWGVYVVQYRSPHISK